MAAAAIPLLLLAAVVMTVPAPASALNQDGVLLLSFKFSLAADPLGSLAGWGYSDDTPCAWNGVVCISFPSPETARVVSVVLPNAQLVGPIARELGLIEHLRHLDLSGNALNGTVPAELLRAPELRVLSLAGNGITGALSEQIGQLRSLRALNLAGNAFSGSIPANLTILPNLTAVSLANNFFSGELPTGGFPALQVLDVSSNLLNGTLPSDFGSAALRYVNLSSNRLAGAIPPEMATRMPANVTIDLSYNNLTGAIPTVAPFAVQRPTAFAGNAELCGRPLDSLCAFAVADVPPNGSTAKSPPAIAAIPTNPTEALPVGDGEAAGAPPESKGRMRMATIIGIAAGDVAGIGVLLVVFMYVYQVRKKRQNEEAAARQRMGVVFKKPEPDESSPDGGIGRSLSCCLRKKNPGDESDVSTEMVTDTSSSPSKECIKPDEKHPSTESKKKKDGGGAVLVTVDGEAELEMETLLKASAYILGAGGSSIVYKAVLADGVLAVRRIGSEDAGVRRFSELDAHMRAIARIRHGNVLRLRGFYWGPDEMLLIHDFAANGSLANHLGYIKRKQSSSPSPVVLGWSARLRIARGVARGLAFVHEKKFVHGNVRPSNILLDADMEPLLADLGIHRLLLARAGAGAGETAAKSKRSAKSLPDLSPPPGGASPMAAAAACGSGDTAAQYQAPEGLKNTSKANAKWDVYSFGMVLIELVAGRALSSLELCQWSSASAGADEQVFRLADAALRGEMAGREDALATCLRLGFACCAMAPNKRPSMKEVLAAMDRIPSPSSSSSAP
uniref:Protein kinase domain-containing protein n=1 Tax=Leersia perrieri TaxID=77586 RepID=A0A0D9XBD3_9ORYZ